MAAIWLTCAFTSYERMSTLTSSPRMVIT
jgi:hypothetical protein